LTATVRHASVNLLFMVASCPRRVGGDTSV
jgi:hypothetical protein